MASYTLSCANAVGTSPTSTAELRVTTPSSGGGGGDLDGAALLGLAVLLRSRRSRLHHASGEAEASPTFSGRSASLHRR
jgi:hypothetical protein